MKESELIIKSGSKKKKTKEVILNVNKKIILLSDQRNEIIEDIEIIESCIENFEKALKNNKVLLKTLYENLENMNKKINKASR